MATRYNYLVIAVKTLTFVPLAAVIYYTEYAKWVNYFYVTTYDAGFITASFALFALGVILKRRIIVTYLQTSKNNFILGSITLTVAAALFILGTVYFLSSPIPPYESLIVFALAYVLLRSDARLIRLLWPLFAILGIAPLASVLSSAMGSLISGLIVFLVMFGLFDAYLVRSIDTTRENLKLLGLPTLIVILGLVYWFVPAEWFLVALIPICLLFLVAPKIGPKLRFARLGHLTICPGHSEMNGSGFCSICGEKFASSKNLTSSGLAGLLISIIVLGIFLTTQIPVFTVSSSGANTSVYSYSGVSTHSITAAPNGWLVNSSVVLTEPFDSFAARLVYVPSYHPELKNYTLYFEMSPTSPYLSSTAWGALPGFNRTATGLTLDGFGGALINYSSANSFMIVFTGKTTFTILEGSNFYLLEEAVSYVRTFTGVNSTAAKSDFVSDLNSVLLPALEDQGPASSWTHFFQRASETLNALTGLLLMLFTSAALVAGTFLVKQSDYKINAFDVRASESDDKEWTVLSMLVEYRTGLTALEIYSIMKNLDTDIIGLRRMLENLETRHLVKHLLLERKSEIFLGWQASMN